MTTLRTNATLVYAPEIRVLVVTDNDGEVKTCRKCNVEQPLTSFHKRAKNQDGLQIHCKSCVSANDKRRYVEDPDQFKEQAAKWAKNNPERRREIEAEWQLANPERQKANVAAYYEANKEVLQAFNREWAKNNPARVRAAKATSAHRRRAQIADDKVNVQDWIDLCELYGNICLCCGKAEITMDHVVPLSRGGRHLIWNLQPLCGSCNSSKYTKSTDYREVMFSDCA